VHTIVLRKEIVSQEVQLDSISVNNAPITMMTMTATNHIILHTHQFPCWVNRSDAGSKVPPKELAEVAVFGEVLDGSFLKTTTKQPDVEAKRWSTQPRRQHKLVELSPQPRYQLQRHLPIQAHLSSHVQSWISPAEVSTTNIYYKFIQLKWRNLADCSAQLVKQYVAHNWLTAELGWPALASY